MRSDVFPGDCLAQFLNFGFHLGVFVGWDLVTSFLDSFFHLVSGIISHGCGLRPTSLRFSSSAEWALASCTIRSISLFCRLVDGGDGHLLLASGGFILGGHVQDAIGIDIKGDFDLRHTARSMGMPSRRKRPRVILSAAIGRSPCSTWISTAVWLSSAVEKICDLRIGNGGIAFDERGHHTAHCFHTQ